jgi:hypothetical protein
LLPQITFLPPAPQTLHYDEHAFACRRARSVTEDTRLAYSDIQRMHVHRHSATRGRRFIPEFATNPEQLRKVLTLFAWRYARASKKKNVPVPEGITLDELRRITDERFEKDVKQKRRPESQISQRENDAFERFCFVYGQGWLRVHAAVAWRSWLLGYESTQVAAGLFMSPQQVRVVLWRLNLVARELGFNTFPAGRKGRKDWTEEKAHRIHRAWLRSLEMRLIVKGSMPLAERKKHMRAYDKVWRKAHSQGLTVPQWRAVQLERLKQKLALGQQRTEKMFSGV